jgi:hypothetical protein
MMQRKFRIEVGKVFQLRKNRYVPPFCGKCSYPLNQSLIGGIGAGASDNGEYVRLFLQMSDAYTYYFCRST